MIQKVWIKNLRNLSELLLDFKGRKHCFIYGGNNQGKTSILESIYVASKHQSPIQTDLAKIINHENKEACIGIDFDEETPQRLYAKITESGKKEIWLNNKKETKKHTAKRPMIYISADALHLFQKEPDFRRKHLDNFCCHFFTSYEELLKKYEKCLKQKNRYLKQVSPQVKVLNTYNETLIYLAKELVTLRKEALQQINNQIEKEQFIFNEKQTISINYKMKNMDKYGVDTSYEDNMRRCLNEDVEKEKILGYSLTGPHRDDFEVCVDNKKLFDYYSRGINRLFTILFQTSQLSLLYRTNQQVYVLLDDAFAEIDEQNTQKIINRFCNERQQVIYVSTSRQHFPYFNNCCLYSIKAGKLTDETV